MGIHGLLLGVSLGQEEFKWAFVRWGGVLTLERDVSVALELGQSEVTLFVTVILGGKIVYIDCICTGCNNAGQR